MDIFGMDPVTATIVLTGVGLVLKNVVGWLKDDKAFNIRHAAASGIIAFFGSSIAVGGVIDAIPNDIAPVVMYTTIASAIATVAGFDSLLKGGAKAAAKAVKP